MTFLAQPLTLTVADGDRVLVNSSKAFGSTLWTGGLELNLWICSQPEGGTIGHHGFGVLNLAVASGSRHLFTVSEMLDGLAPGTHQVGLCGYSANNSGSWNSNDFSYTTAIVTK